MRRDRPWSGRVIDECRGGGPVSVRGVDSFGGWGPFDKNVAMNHKRTDLDTRDRPEGLLHSALAVVLLGALAETGGAEIYIAGEAGAAFPSDLRHVSGTGAIHGVGFGNLDLADTGLYGGKLGYFFDDKGRQWLGVEVEGFAANPHVKQQAVSAAGAQATAGALGSGAHVRVVTMAFNVVARYPRGPVQPYVGLGLALVNAKVSGPNLSASNSSPGLNLLAGIKVAVTERLAIFCEEKYTYTSFQFEDAGLTGVGIKGIYAAPAVVGGLAWHFR